MTTYRDAIMDRRQYLSVKLKMEKEFLWPRTENLRLLNICYTRKIRSRKLMQDRQYNGQKTW